MEAIIKMVWLLLPAGLANISPVLFNRVPFLNYPIDLNKKVQGKPLFGSNKTYRGFFFAIITAILAVYIQKLLYPYTESISLLNYQRANIYLLGFLLGFGALFGDLVESFFKRRLSIAPGKPWIPFDQIDWVLGALLFASFYTPISLLYAVGSVIIFGLLHPVINLIGYCLGIKQTKF